MNEIIETAACPNCYETDNAPYGYEFTSIDDQDVKLGLNKCSKCGMQFISPRLSNQGLTQLYQSYHTSTVSGKYNTESDVSKLEYVAFSKYIKKHLPNGGNVLDVGCGIGNLISELRGDTKYKVSGIEFSEVAANRAIEKGFNVKCGDLIKEKYPTKSFDSVVLLYVLEHVSNPREILNEINKILKDDGYFFMAVPNYRYLKIAFDNKISKLLFGTKVSLHAEEHLQNFTPKTLSNMLKQENYIIIKQNIATPLNTGSFVIKSIKWFMYIILNVLFLFGYNVGGIHIVAKKRNEG